MYAKKMAESRPLDMRLFDPRAGYKLASSLVGRFGSPRRNAIFQNYVDHVDTEGRGDYAGLMATCSKKSQSYAAYFSPAGPTTGLPQCYAELERLGRARLCAGPRRIPLHASRARARARGLLEQSGDGAGRPLRVEAA